MNKRCQESQDQPWATSVASPLMRLLLDAVLATKNKGIVFFFFLKMDGLNMF